MEFTQVEYEVKNVSYVTEWESPKVKVDMYKGKEGKTLYLPLDGQYFNLLEGPKEILKCSITVLHEAVRIFNKDVRKDPEWYINLLSANENVLTPVESGKVYDTIVLDFYVQELYMMGQIGATKEEMSEFVLKEVGIESKEEEFEGALEIRYQLSQRLKGKLK